MRKHASLATTERNATMQGRDSNVCRGPGGWVAVIGMPKRICLSSGIVTLQKRSCQFLSPENHRAMEQPIIHLPL
jgi:hypothetical protein